MHNIRSKVGTPLALLVTVALVMTGTGGVLAQESFHVERYEFLGRDGEIVRDTVTGLEWMRCSLGQTWNGATQHCTGIASAYTFEGSRDAVTQMNRAGGYGGFTDWRLPVIEELRTIVYCSSGQPARFKKNNAWCSGRYSRPTVVPAAFPDTPSTHFWADSGFATHSNYAWSVHFGHGFANDRGNLRSYYNHVRLVRSGQ